MEKTEYTQCFGCGKDNPIGLKLDMHVNESDSYAEFVPKPEHQSYDDRMHGGLVSTLIDEVMGNHVFVLTGKPAYTADLHLRFKASVKIGEKVRIESHIVSRRGRLFVTKGCIIKENGTVAVTAEAKLMTAS